jgi:hypothetical protein
MQVGAAVVALLLCPLSTFAQARKVDMPHSEQMIGSWLLSCATDPMTDMQACRMRAKLWLIPPEGDQAGMALEVQLRSGALVPVVVVRKLSLNTAWSGLLALAATAQIRFDEAAMAALPCLLEGASVVCAPTQSDAGRLSDDLTKAKTVLVRFRAIGNLPLPAPEGPLALDLDHTPEALARYRVAGPEVAPVSSSLARDVKDAAERLLRDLGVTGSDTEQRPPQ